ncbi:alcohol dehydrogenase catalytic domain-containing protein, partial [Microbacteriaceae bacterium K1510]|nr:alcohol dehydrogenase catalytic domain-containing protein [Microbacteriaceae bacterium K1510]
MYAVTKMQPGPGAAWSTANIPEPAEKEVLLRVKIAAICGTDLHIYAWDDWAANANLLVPGIMGHECIGEVVKVGREVTALAVGDRVSVETHIPCGSCRLCHSGRQHICENLRLFGLHTNGCFTTWTTVPAICARKVPAAITDEVGAVLEPLGVGVHAADISQVTDKRVAVLGAGPIGIFSACASLALGAESVCISDVQSNRLTIASQCGDLLTWNPTATSTSAMLSGQYAPDVIIETTGNDRALMEALPCLRKGGEVVLAGLFQRPVSLQLSSDIVFKEATLRGIHGRKMWDTWDTMEELLIT